MTRGRRAALLFIAAGASLAAGAGTAIAQEADATTLRGRVADVDGLPVGGVRLTVTPGDAGSVGGDGRFEVRAPRGTLVLIRAAAPGFLPVEREVVATSAAGLLRLTLTRAPHLLAPLTVTGATRAEVGRVAGATTVVEAREIRQRTPLSVMDALRTVPGAVTADEDPFGLNLNIGFRGLPPRRSSRTLLLEDGVPILLGPYGDPSMHYGPPVEALERIEIVQGAGQVVNGPQTVGGVINFVTRRPPVAGTFATVTLGGGGIGYRNGHVWLGTGRDGYGLSLDYTYREGDGVRREQAHRSHNVVASGTLPLGLNQSVLLKAGFWDEDSRISETGLTRSEFLADPFSLPFSDNGTFDVRRYLAQAVHEVAFGRTHLRTNVYASNTVRASWRQSGESEERLGTADYAEDFNCAPGATAYEQCGNQGRPREYSMLGVEPRLSLRFGAHDAVTIDVGARLHHEDIRRRQFLGTTPTSREDAAALTRDNEIITTAIAAFAQTRLRAGAFTFTPGLRVERIAQDNRNVFPGSEAELHQSYTQLLPGIGATFEARPAVTLFTGLHRGFAPPRPADVYRPEPGQSIVLVDPETSWNWEAGARLGPHGPLSGSVTVFNMDFGNQIIEAPAASGQRFINGGESVHRGVEMSGRVDLAALLGARAAPTIEATHTWLPVARLGAGDERRIDLEGNRLPYAPRHVGSVSASFAPATGLVAGAALEYTDSQFADEQNTVEPSDDGQSGVLPAYHVVNLFATYTVPGTRLQLRGGIRNVFASVYITQRNEGIHTGMRRVARAELRWTY